MKTSFGSKILIALGFFCLAVGAIGVFVPLLPTTPLALLAAYLFARSSIKYHAWLRQNRLFGKTVRAWEAKLGLTRTEKFRMIFFATLFIGISFILCPNIAGRIVLGIVWPIPVLIALLSKTRPEDLEV